MYIDVALIDDCKKRYPAFQFKLEEFIENCGLWLPSPDSVRAEWEDFDASLEEICSTYYFIIEDNKMLFCSPDIFWDDVSDYVIENNLYHKY